MATDTPFTGFPTGVCTVFNKVNMLRAVTGIARPPIATRPGGPQTSRGDKSQREDSATGGLLTRPRDLGPLCSW